MKILRRTLIALTTAALLGAGAVGGAAAADVKSRMIRFGYGLAEDTNQGRATKRFVDGVDFIVVVAPDDNPFIRQLPLHQRL